MFSNDRSTISKDASFASIGVGKGEMELFVCEGEDHTSIGVLGSGGSMDHTGIGELGIGGMGGKTDFGICGEGYLSGS